MEKKISTWNKLVAMVSDKSNANIIDKTKAKMYLDQMNTASGGHAEKEAAHWLESLTPVTFETGATSPAVNELILYTDNTRELAEKRDHYYTWFKSKPIVYFTDFRNLFDNARSRYRHEYGLRASQQNWIDSLSSDQIQEYCQIYANRFAEWKKEKELEPYNEYRTAKLDIGEEPMTFEQWKAAENDLSDYDTK